MSSYLHYTTLVSLVGIPAQAATEEEIEDLRKNGVVA